MHEVEHIVVVTYENRSLDGLFVSVENDCIVSYAMKHTCMAQALSKVPYFSAGCAREWHRQLVSSDKG